MKRTSILSALYTILAVMGLGLLFISYDATHVVIGMGSVILGVLGLEARSIAESIDQSRNEV